nr:MAG TPA_asm: hypothetical protein [Bacteriophage sp.]
MNTDRQLIYVTKKTTKNRSRRKEKGQIRVPKCICKRVFVVFFYFKKMVLVTLLELLEEK